MLKKTNDDSFCSDGLFLLKHLSTDEMRKMTSTYNNRIQKRQKAINEIRLCNVAQNWRNVQHPRGKILF